MLNLSVPKTAGRIGAVDISHMEALLASGLGVTDVATEVGCDRKTVRYHTDPAYKAHRKQLRDEHRARRKDNTHQRMVDDGWTEDKDWELWMLADRLTHHSKSRSLLTTLWAYEKLVAGVCEATGKSLRPGEDGPWKPSLDRRVPGHQGGEYTLENTRMVCYGYNCLKLGYSDSQALEFLMISTS